MHWNTTLGFAAMIILLFTGCVLQEDVTESNSLTKAEQEALGELIAFNYDSEESIFEFLPYEAPYDSVYWYLQTLYDQATIRFRADSDSPRDNRWDQNRTWGVHIIKSNFQKNAFVIPGGDLYITTGMLEALEQVDELYYILAFEGSVMANGFLMTQIQVQFGERAALGLIDPSISSGGLTVESLASFLPQLRYDTEVVKLMDEAAIQEICTTAAIYPGGLETILPKLEEFDSWVSSKPSYEGRWAIGLERDPAACGSLRNDGSYQKFVLDKL